MVGAQAFMRVAKSRSVFAMYITLISELHKKIEGLSIRYKEFQDVFEKKNANTLPQHRPYNCTIKLQEGTQLPFGPIYGLSQNELVAL